MTWPIRNHRLTCERSGVRHLVQVATPTRYEDKPDAAWPVIVVLDGPWLFGTVVDATRVMSMAREAPEAIVVGISFDEPDMAELLRQRARWYSPTQWVPPIETAPAGIEAEETGRALELRDFIEHQVLPLVEAGHRCTDERWLVGHSFSALCGVRILLDRAQLFDRYLLASPSIWWHDKAMLQIEQAAAAVSDDLAAQVFITVGEEEWSEEPYNMLANAQLLMNQLESRGYPGLSTTLEVCAKTGHNSSIGAAVSLGLRSLLALSDSSG